MRAAAAGVLLSLALAASGLRSGRAAAVQPLRVCADPAYMPFSDRAGRGFENRIAATVAHALGRGLEYTWYSMRTPGGFDQFVQDTLNAHKCDLIVDIPYAEENVLTTRPYYISSYVFVFKKSKGYDITSMDSPVLRTVKIGYEADTPAEGGLKLRALTVGAKPYDVADTEGESPEVILDAVDSGTINVAITWDPAIGYFLRDHPGLTVVRVPNSRSQGSPEQYTFPMSMAVRSNDTALHDELNRVIAQDRGRLESVLREYGIEFFTSRTNV